jgi:hypothetical protein
MSSLSLPPAPSNLPPRLAACRRQEKWEALVVRRDTAGPLRLPPWRLWAHILEHLPSSAQDCKPRVVFSTEIRL